MVVSPNRATPIFDNPCYEDPQEGTTNLGKPRVKGPSIGGLSWIGSGRYRAWGLGIRFWGIYYMAGFSTRMCPGDPSDRDQKKN